MAEYAQVFRQLQERGTPIPQNDIWIAATALVRRAPLCTFDDHFKNVEALDLVDLISEAVNGSCTTRN